MGHPPCTCLGLRLRLVLANECVLEAVHLVGLAVHQDHVGRLEGADEPARLPEIFDSCVIQCDSAHQRYCDITDLTVTWQQLVLATMVRSGIVTRQVVF